jgi:hypothetical protein
MLFQDGLSGQVGLSHRRMVLLLGDRQVCRGKPAERLGRGRLYGIQGRGESGGQIRIR